MEIESACYFHYRVFLDHPHHLFVFILLVYNNFYILVGDLVLQ
jgi:hypothetical protein